MRGFLNDKSPAHRTMKLIWAPVELAQLHIDHARFQRLNDQVYLTLGQTFIPIDQHGAPEQVEVRPMGRFVMSLATAKNIANLLYRNLEGEPE